MCVVMNVCMYVPSDVYCIYISKCDGNSACYLNSITYCVIFKYEQENAE